MFEYTQEELLEKIEKAINKMTESQYKVDKQSIYLGNFLKEIKTAIEKDKSLNIKNIQREITNSINVNRPEWIEELKLDTSDLEEGLKDVVDSIDNKENATEFDIKEASWLTGLLSDIKTSQDETTKTIEKKLNIKADKIKIPKKMKVSGTVDIGNKLEIKEPKWLPKQADYTKQLKAIEKKLTPADNTKLLDALEKLTTTEDMKTISEYLQAILNKPQFDLEEILVDGRIPVAVDKSGGGGGATTDTSNLATIAKQNEMIAAMGGGVAEALEFKKDSTDSKVSYIGKATIASDTGDAVWKIQKMDENDGTVITWADGNDNYDNIYDNRESLTYL